MQEGEAAGVTGLRGTPRVAGLVLAAGAGRRFGGPKALAEVAGERLIDRTVRVARAGGLAHVVVVSGAAGLDLPDVVHNAGWPEGMGSSLRVGLRAMAPDVDAALVLLVDQPGITGSAVERVRGAVEGSSALVVATYRGAWGHPVALGRTHWPEVLETATGDRGAREVLRRHAAEVVTVECGDVATADDVDTAADLASWRAGAPR